MGVALRVNGKMKQETFPVANHPSEKKLWAHLETSIALLNAGSDQPLPVAVTMATVNARYRKEYLPELSSKSARGTYNSALTRHIEPRWSKVPVADVKAIFVVREISYDLPKLPRTCEDGTFRRVMTLASTA
ncbi:MAG: hypothetical protein JWQ49_1422 [Edaphobacter sp.]|nr:hypothetical protein [Edaphobacter sp.]